MEPVCRTQGTEHNFRGFVGKRGGSAVRASFPSVKRTRAAKLHSRDDSQLQPRHALLNAAQASGHGHLSLQLWASPLQEKQAGSFETSRQEATSGAWQTCLTEHYRKGKAWRARAWAFTLQTQLCMEGEWGASKLQLLSGAAQAEEDWAKTA